MVVSKLIYSNSPANSLPPNLEPSVIFLSSLLPQLIHSSAVMGATALVPLFLSLAFLSEKAVDLAGRETDQVKKVKFMGLFFKMKLSNLGCLV